MVIMTNMSDSKGSVSRKERRQQWWKKQGKGTTPGNTNNGIKLRVRKPKVEADETRQASVIETQHGFKLKLKLNNKSAKVTNNNTSKPKSKTVKSKDTPSPQVPASPKKKTASKPKSTEESTPAPPKPKSYVLFVGNLPFDITKDQLLDHFRRTGGAKSARIPKEKGTDRGRGFAYIEFKDGISFRVGLRLHQTTLAGRKINVEFTSIGGNNKHRREKLDAKNKSLEKFKMNVDER